MRGGNTSFVGYNSWKGRANNNTEPKLLLSLLIIGGALLATVGMFILPMVVIHFEGSVSYVVTALFLNVVIGAYISMKYFL